ncbi:RNA exonuclease 1 homolog isoform X2 [Lathamus discolor]|uniref:RNA exonuclease 1 homolog isoform X2 n=1 Tax=Lathamus discolor TaxID=678569 RepID=UPI0032B83384
MWSVGCFAPPRCSFSGDPAQQPRRSRSRRASRRRASRRRAKLRAARQLGSALPQGEGGQACPAGGSRDPPVLRGCRLQGLSSERNEDKNAKQQFNPAIPPCGNWGGNSKMPPFESGCAITKMPRNSFPTKSETELSDSDDEGRLVIDLPPEVPNKKPRIRRNSRYANRDEELAAIMWAGKLHDDAIADILGSREGKSEEITLQKNSKSLNKLGKLGSVSPKASKIFLPDINNSGILKVLEEIDAPTNSEDKYMSSAASAEAGMEKGILKQGNAKTNKLVKAFQESTTNEVCVKSRRVAESPLCHSSKDETAIGRTYMETINTEKTQSIEESGGNGSAKDTYQYPTYYSNKKESGPGSSTEEAEASGEDTGSSEPDDPLEECRRIFDEFEREAQKKDRDKQAHGRNVDLNLLETNVNVPGQKRRVAHMAKFDVPNKNEMVFFKASPWQQHHNTRIQQASFHSPVFTWKRPSILEPGCKVPQETRQRYFTCFLTECVKTCSTVNEAINKALKEEQSIYDRFGNKKMYLNLAVKTLKKLREQPNNSRYSIGIGSLPSEEEKAFTGGALYELLKKYVLTKEQLNENNFPRQHPGKNGAAILTGVKNAECNAFKKVCCRCGEIYAVTSSGTHQSKEECSYHSGGVLKQRVPGGVEKRYSCCERVVGSPGCQIAKLHVHDGRREKLEGFMKTLTKSPPLDGTHDVYALNCEMCYTTRGLELTRVTVVDPKLQVVYDTFVKPDGKVVDYDIRLSGVKENDLKNTTTNLRAVQAVLLNLFNVDTILIGHNLENDLFVLKLIHGMVVDTSVVFPHSLGLPHKRTLRSLTADYLRRIHQDDDCVNGTGLAQTGLFL